MKKLIVLFLMVSFLVSLSSKSIFNNLVPSTISLMYNTLSVEDGVKFYILDSEVFNENLYTRVRHIFTDSTTYKEHEYRISYEYKFIGIRARWQKNELVNLDMYEIDLRGLWKGWSIGGMNAWDTAPKLYFIFGKKFNFKLDFFILPGYISTTSDFMTSDFNEWYKENTLKLKLRTEIQIFENILDLFGKEITVPAVYIKIQYRLKDYGKTISEILFGFEIDF